MVEIRQYVDELGRSRYAQWLGTLDDVAMVRVLRSLARLEHGNLSNT